MKIEEKERQTLSSEVARRAGDETKILFLHRDAARVEPLQSVGQDIGSVLFSRSAEEASLLASHSQVDVLVVEQSLGDYSRIRAVFTPKTSVLIIVQDETSAAQILRSWPSDYFVDFVSFPIDETGRERFRRLLQKAADHARLKRELEKLVSSRGPDEERIKEVYSEIKEIKSFLNDNVVKEMEKRLSLQVRYLWFQRRKQKIEEIIKKIHVADDVSSLLDTVADIKQLIQASGMTFYILDENETLGKFLKPLVWDDAFLSHAEFSRYIALLDSHDFAAQVVRRQEDINIAAVPLERRLAKRYIEHLKQPLRSLLSVPIRHEKEVIGVLETYNKLHKGEV
ncbi:MAG: GAF domain-containing protein, partial [Candidatus Aminicenantes bacterium]|nr:GAF domain-containing protein [Candidatus Aminicenantes bacterium]